MRNLKIKTTILAVVATAALATANAQNSILSGPYASNPNVTSEHTLGTKKLLLIRCHFPDIAPVLTYEQVLATLDKDKQDNTRGLKQRYGDYSYGKMTLEVTVTATDYLMPQPASYYATQPTAADCWSALWRDSQQLANQDYPVNAFDGGSFDFVGTYTPTIPKFTGSKIGGTSYGSFGTKWFYVHGLIDAGIVTHEFGHACGSRHSNWWKVSDGDPFSAAGKSVENGDSFDTMGAAHQIKADFNPWVKNHFGWLDDSQVMTITAPGTYPARINRFDHPLATGLLAVKIPRGDGSNVWVGIRRKWGTTKPLETTGAYIIIGFDSPNNQSRLIDCNTPGSDISDSALQVGQTVIDAAHGIAITALAIGGTAPNEWMDIEVTRP